MVYKCINCHKDIVNFSCDCGRVTLTWDRRGRIDENKKQKRENEK